MRIGFEAKKMATNATGIGNYSRGVARLVRENTDWQCVFFAPRRGPGLPADAECVCAPGGTSLGREWWRCRGVVEDIRRRHIDLFHGLSNELPFGIGRAGCKTVVTIHDLIFLRYPGTYGTLARRVLKAKTLYACRHADRIIAASECTKRDLMAFYHVPEERISVVYQGCDPRFRRRLSPGGVPGTAMPDERLERVLRLVHRRIERGEPVPLSEAAAVGLEAPPGFEPGSQGFAGPCLTTWL